MAAGYLYVLVNSSMPGLVKVGKTTRDPTDRANELSNATGVPTPFVLAFDSYFADCDAAERYVHVELEKRGLRQAANREFFRASTSEIIKILLKTPGEAEENRNKIKNLDDSEMTKDSETKQDGLSYLIKNPWDDIISSAMNYCTCNGDEPQNYEKAFILFNQAKNLGSLLSYEEIGMMQSLGEGTEESDKNAFITFGEGAKNGNYYCISQMATLISTSELFEIKTMLFDISYDIEKWEFLWESFFKLRNKFIIFGIENYDGKYEQECVSYISNCLENNFPVKNREYLRYSAENIINYCKKCDNKSNHYYNFRDYKKIIKWVEKNLL